MITIYFSLYWSNNKNSVPSSSYMYSNCKWAFYVLVVTYTNLSIFWLIKQHQLRSYILSCMHKVYLIASLRCDALQQTKKSITIMAINHAISLICLNPQWILCNRPEEMLKHLRRVVNQLCSNKDLILGNLHFTLLNPERLLYLSVAGFVSLSVVAV